MELTIKPKMAGWLHASLRPITGSTVPCRQRGVEVEMVNVCVGHVSYKTLGSSSCHTSEITFAALLIVMNLL